MDEHSVVTGLYCVRNPQTLIRIASTFSLTVR
jgi:hypothetical protein